MVHTYIILTALSHDLAYCLDLDVAYRLGSRPRGRIEPGMVELLDRYCDCAFLGWKSRLLYKTTFERDRIYNFLTYHCHSQPHDHC